MGRRGSISKAQVLGSLLGQPPTSGFELCAALRATGLRCTPGTLLPALLALADAELVEVDRSADPHRFSLTNAGRAAAHAAHPGRVQPAVLVMVDLVGFTRFTSELGDRAAHEEASRFTQLVKAAVAPWPGALVKSLGDGVLLQLPAGIDPVPMVGGLAHALRERPPVWQVHAAARVGSPIRHGGDVFGADVNLVARLCALARPNELLISSDDGEDTVELEGFPDPARVRRVRL